MFRLEYSKVVERKRIITPPNVKLRLNRGERPEPLPFEILQRIEVCVGSGTIQQYPSYPQFYQQLANHIGFPVENIVVGAGIEEFIRTLMFLCCAPRQKAAVLWPTCAMYDIYAKAFDVDLTRIRTVPGGETLVEDIIDELGTDTKVLFLPNPGQPVETHFNLRQIEELADYCCKYNILLAVDEAHFGFGAVTALPLVYRFDNLLVMRTFSKFFGVASIRVGFVVGQERVIGPINSARPSGEIAGPSMRIASLLLEPKNYKLMVEEGNRTITGRSWARKELRQMGLQVSGYYGFSLLIQFNSTEAANRVGTDLAKNGVYVKHGFPPPVDKCMLLSCGSLPLMERFVAELKRVYREE